MVQYILANAFAFSISTIFAISTFLLGFVSLYRASKQGCPERRPTVFFSLALFTFGAAHAIWAFRAAFFPTHPGIPTILPYWQGFWILFMTGLFFIGIWSILIANPMWLQTHKWIALLIFLPWIIVTADVLFLTNSITAEWVCGALITDIRPDLVVIFTVGLSLTFFIGLAIDFFYQKFKGYESKFMPFLVLLGLLLFLIGGLLETRVFPVCQVITMGRVIMLIGLWLTAYGVIRVEI
ncbi:MAG: hypothetical protein ACFFCH_01905 [Promethearchaeota archaeon]